MIVDKDNTSLKYFNWNSRKMVLLEQVQFVKAIK